MPIRPRVLDECKAYMCGRVNTSVLAKMNPLHLGEATRQLQAYLAAIVALQDVL